MCVCRYVHRSSLTDDATSQSLAFFPKTALKLNTSCSTMLHSN